MVDVETSTMVDADTNTMIEGDTPSEPIDTDDPTVLVEKPKVEKPKKPRAPKTLRLKVKKKKTPATLLLKGKKRKRKNSGSDAEAELGETEVSNFKETLDKDADKRRSSRVTKKTKYIDDVDLNLSDDDGKAPE